MNTFPFLNFDVGLKSELDELERLAEEGHTVLLNSVTNFLRTGDIIVKDKDTGAFRLEEVKTGTMRSPRTIRQREQLIEVQEGLDTGSYSMAGVKIARIPAEIPLRTYVKSVERAMGEADEKYGASRLYGEYLSIGIYAFHKMTNSLDEAEMDQIRQTVLDRCFSVIRHEDDICLPVLSNMDTKLRFSPNVAPYGIFPISPERRLQLLTCDFWVISLLNISGLARWLEKRGWRVEISSFPEDFPERDEFPYVSVMSVWKGRKGVQLGLDILCVAALEFWMPETIESMVEVIYNQETLVSGYFQVVHQNTGKYAWD